MPKSIIAIDPGASGGIAYWMRGTKIISYPMPDTEGDIMAEIRDHVADAKVEGAELVAFVEEVGGFICGQGQPGSAMFKFGRGFGFLLGTLMALGVRVELVKPQKWQKALGLGTKAGGTTGDWKRKLKAEAQRRFPDQKVTLSTADALLILEYGRAQQ